MSWRTGRIWRLGEQELVVRKYNAPRRIELHGALEDREPSPLSWARGHQGIAAYQLTCVHWHELWGLA